MRRRFPSDDEPQDNYFDPDESSDGDDPELPEGLVEEIAAAIGKEDVINAMQFDLAQLGLNQSLLRIAISVASQNGQWKLRNNEDKLRDIEMIYKRLQQLTNGEEDESDPEEGTNNNANL